MYLWGLEDAKDQTVLGGYDLQSAGIQSYAAGKDTLHVFAVSLHDRFSNAAATEIDVLIDTNRDGRNDLAVFSYDSGAIRAGDADGENEVFVYDLKTGALASSGFLAVSPTDSSTVLLPVLASSMGHTGSFQYTVASFYGDPWDQFDAWAHYNPSKKPGTTWLEALVEPNGVASIPVTIDRGVFSSSSRPLGLMVVSYDNPAGDEALVMPIQ